MPSCVAIGCSKNSARDKRQQNVQKKVSFFKFPNERDAERRRIWVRNVNRSEWTPTPHSVLCELHFEKSMFVRDFQLDITGTPFYKRKLLDENAIPRKFLCNSVGEWEVGKPVPVRSMAVSSDSCAASATTSSSRRPKPRTHTEERLRKAEQKQMVNSLLNSSSDSTLPHSTVPSSKKTSTTRGKPDRTKGRAKSKRGDKAKEPPVPSSTHSLHSIQPIPQVSRAPTYGNPQVVLLDHPYSSPQQREQDHSLDICYTNQSGDVSMAVSNPAPAQPTPSSSCEISPQTHDNSPPQQLDMSFELPGTSECEDENDLYVPSSTDESEVQSEEDEQEELSNFFIVHEENLTHLMRRCQECGATVTSKKKNIVGSMVVYHISCLDGHTVTWTSQPRLGKTSLGNILIAAAVLFTGLTYTRIAAFAKAMNIAIIGKSTFNNVQRELLFPVIQEAWDIARQKVISVRRNMQLILAGDCRCDSPGHCAKYGGYTLMDTEERPDGPNKIVSLQLVQCSEVKSSNHMEPEGLRRALAEISADQMDIKILATDRHIMVNKIMNTEYPNIDHQFDVWHVAKSVIKKLSAKAKTKKNADLLPWIQSVSNHMWWCCATCNGDPQELKERWISILHHITNKHRWSGSTKFKKCGHPRLTDEECRDKAWLKPDSSSFQALKDVVMEKRLLTALPKLAQFCHTGHLEVFHSMLLKYLPKRQHFPYDGMKARSMLAALDWNSQTKTVQEEADGSAKIQLVHSKRRKVWVPKTKYHRVAGNHISPLIERTLQVKRERLSLEPMRRPTLPPNIALVEKPSKDSMQHRSRFMHF